MRRWGIIVAILSLLAVVVAVSAHHEVLPDWGRLVVWVFEQQRQFHRAMATQLRGAASQGLVTWGLVSVSFLYGVFHAAGPGHGKAVVATYLATHEGQVRRAIVLSVGAALCQGLVAVLLVQGFVLLAGWLPHDTQVAVEWSERLSFVLLALLGAVFAIRAVRAMVRTMRRRPAIAAPVGHVHDEYCGCSHGPSAEQTARAGDWRGTVAVLLAIGLRPCSGAILVLGLANVLGMVWAGIGAVLAMSAGTAMAVAVLAVVVVKARHWAIALLTDRHAVLSWAGPVMALVGGALILSMGLSLLSASFGPAHPLM